MDRVIVYIDGFNLYYGLKEAGFRKSYWLNVFGVAQEIGGTGRSLHAAKYFTARIGGAQPGDSPSQMKERNGKRARQTTYLEALTTLPGLSIFYGTYLAKSTTCFGCRRTYLHQEEKMTDVNIATEMLTDAFQDKFDVAMLISADSDLVPPSRTIRSLFPSKQVAVYFPPKRTSVNLRNTASAAHNLFPHVLHKNQLPDPVTRADGFKLIRPTEWH